MQFSGHDFVIQQDAPVWNVTLLLSEAIVPTLQGNYDTVEHWGLISRAGLQGNSQDTSLTSDGPMMPHELSWGAQNSVNASYKYKVEGHMREYRSVEAQWAVTMETS